MIKQEQADKFLGKHEPKELKEADLASSTRATVKSHFLYLYLQFY